MDAEPEDAGSDSSSVDILAVDLDKLRSLSFRGKEKEVRVVESSTKGVHSARPPFLGSWAPERQPCGKFLLRAPFQG